MSMEVDVRHRFKVVLAFASIYLVWGSTYAAIMVAIETMPPFLMAGVRFLIAGALVHAWTRWRGAPRPTRRQWRNTAIVGVLLLAVGNGGVVWSEQFVPSSVAALLVASVAFWMVLLEWLRPGGIRPTPTVVVGLVIGFGGLAILMAPGEFGGGRIDPIGAAGLLVATFGWAAGSIYSRGTVLPASPFQATGMEMLAGGGALVLMGAATGELAGVDPAAISTRSLLGFVYLIVFGSLIGFTAYIWLLGVSTPAKISTYAYVNPVVAVLLGWGLLGESITSRMGIAMVVVIAAVAVITTERTRRAHPPPPPPSREPRGRPDRAERPAGWRRYPPGAGTRTPAGSAPGPSQP